MIQAVTEIMAHRRAERCTMTRRAMSVSLMAILVALQVSTNAHADGAAQPGRASITAPERDLHSSKTIRLWDGPPPGALGNAPQDIPTLTIVPPDRSGTLGTAVIIAPGGGYQVLDSNQGREVADWFAAHGVTAFILSYRLISNGYIHPNQLSDAQRAIRWVRAHADGFGVAPNRIGMIGFSAGGHLTGMAETVFDAGDPLSPDPVQRVSCRPDFAILAYAALVFEPNDPTPSMFAGPKASLAEVRQTMPSINVTPETPPTFIFQTTEDRSLATSATGFYNALLAARVPVEAHIFERGQHGVGLGTTDPALSLWPLLLENWLAGRGLMAQPPRQTTG